MSTINTYSMLFIESLLKKYGVKKLPKDFIIDDRTVRYIFDLSPSPLDAYQDKALNTIKRLEDAIKEAKKRIPILIGYVTEVRYFDNNPFIIFVGKAEE